MTLASSLLLLSQITNAETCPQQFFDLPVPEKATTCHSFMEQLPAALSFYVPQSPEQVKQFYQNTQIVITQSSKHLGRYVLHANDKQLRIIISEDEAGTQVDLLALKN